MRTSQLLTIIVPCYNAEKYLNRCLSNLSSLKSSDISILFVNDGSSDQSLQILEAWAEERSNVSIISKENGGYATAVNAGLDSCDSEYVMFMGADDELIQSGIEEICKTLREIQPDILAFTTVKYYDDAVPKGRICEVDSATEYTHEGVYHTDITGLIRMIGNDAWILFTRDTSRCFKKALIKDLRYVGKTGVSADGCFAGLVACRAQTFAFVNTVCYLWHVHMDSVSGSERSKKLEKLTEEAEVWREFFSQFQKEFLTIPDPVVYDFFVYLALIDELRKPGALELAKSHERFANAFSRWAQRTPLTLKSRCKLLFPKLYRCLIQRKNGKC